MQLSATMAPDTEYSSKNLFLKKVKDAVLSNLDNEQFGVEKLSDLMGISRSQLHRKLKLLQSKSISQFIREVRLQEAMKLLQQDVATASEIAYRVGFSSPSYFFKCFQKYYGFPPGEVKNLSTHMATAEENNDLNHLDSSKRDIEEIKKHKRKKNIPILLIGSFAVLFVLISYFGYHYFRSEAGQSIGEKSIAVLPFKNLSTDEENQHFTDGLVDDLLSRLAMLNEFKVISRTSSETYHERGKKKIPKIAKELGVTHLIEGSVQRYDNKIRITVQMIDGENDNHIWVKTFDRDLTDIFKVQSEIAMQIASGLSMALSEKQIKVIEKNQTENVKAFEFYQLGRFYWGKRLFEEYETAIHYFEQAIAEDPDYALAYAGIADTYFLMNWNFQDFEERIKYRDKAEQLASKALEVDPELAEAYTVLATLNFFIDWDWASAEKNFQKAFALTSNNSTLHFRYAEHLSYTGRHEAARKHIDKAIELDPLSYVIRRNSTKLYFNRGLFQEALAEAKISEELNKDNAMPLAYQFRIHFLLGNDSEALTTIKKAQIMHGIPIREHVVDSVYNSSGLDGLVKWIIENASRPVLKARYYNYLGDNEKALDWLEHSFEETKLMTDVPYWYSPNNLLSEPRFITLMNKMGLPWEPEVVQ